MQLETLLWMYATMGVAITMATFCGAKIAPKDTIKTFFVALVLWPACLYMSWKLRKKAEEKTK